MTVTTTEEPLSWQKDARLVPVVALLRRFWAIEVQDAVDRTDCFGLYVLPEPNGGPCDQADKCQLATYCKRVYETAEVQSGEAARAQPAEVHQEANVDLTYARPLFSDTARHGTRSLQRKKKQERKKFNGSDKYVRNGYVECGRHVDTLLAAFKGEIPELPHLPLVWNQKDFSDKFGALGKFTISATASYHSILRDGTVLCRFWTNTTKQAIVDILVELVQPLTRASQKLGKYRYRHKEILQLETPHDVPKKSWMKVRPCTHRVIVRTPEAAKAVARIVRSHWRIGN